MKTIQRSILRMVAIYIQAAELSAGRAAAEHGVRGGARMERGDRCWSAVQTRGIRGGLGRADADGGSRARCVFSAPV